MSVSGRPAAMALCRPFKPTSHLDLNLPGLLKRLLLDEGDLQADNKHQSKSINRPQFLPHVPRGSEPHHLAHFLFPIVTFAPRSIFSSSET